MNFEALNWLINSILDWYLCPHCWAKVDKRNINIKNIDWNAVTLDIFCKVCKKNSIVKSEIVSIDLAKHLNEQQLGVLKNTLNKGKLKIGNISDSEIVKLDKDLKKENVNVSDLFNYKFYFFNLYKNGNY